METEIIKIGDDLGIIIPQEILERTDIEVGQEVEFKEGEGPNQIRIVSMEG